MGIRISEALARFIERHPVWFITLAIIISAVAVPGITLLETETGFSALVSPQAGISMDNSRYESAFGGEPFTVLLTGQTADILSPENLTVMARLEQYILVDERYCCLQSPLTLIEAVTGQSYLQNPQVITAAIYPDGGQLNPILQPLFPDDQHALIVLIPTGNLNDSQALEAAQYVEEFFVSYPLEGTTVTTISDAGLINAITVSIGRNIAILLGLSLAVMIVVLLLFFRVRWRLLSLAMVGISAVWTFGLMGYLSVPMSMATMAVLPILIGLGIDFSIQFHNRYQEEITRCGSVSRAIIVSISRMFPVVGVALLATIAGFITLYISEVPMIRDFGIMLAAGIIISYLVGLFLLHSIVYLADRRTPVERLKIKSQAASGRIERFLEWLGALAVHHTGWVTVIALVFAAAGCIADGYLATNTDYEELMPQDEPALVELRHLREITGSGGQLRFLVESADVASPDVLAWMAGWEQQAIAHYPEILSSNSPAMLVSRAAGGTIPSRPQIDAILAGTPDLFRSRVITDNAAMASLEFNIEYISLEEVHDLIRELEHMASPPQGVKVSSVGTMALGAGTIDAIIGSRMLLNMLCLGAVLLIILVAYRRPVAALLTVIPVGAVIAWSSLDMFLIGIP
ncbi:MAG: RND family transporter, partial [Dehalococcoidaceae bacterium]|nr:RND family transporter [Dehalococcoidaceae bacterium]